MALHAIKKGSGNTYGDYVKWPDEERWELIDGYAYNMTPTPPRIHQEILRDIGIQIANFLTNKPCEVYWAPFDVRLPDANEKDEDIQTVVQPDIVVYCDKTKLDEKGSRGAPDLVVEILSPYTSAKDLKIKLPLYEKHRVKEYWVVFPMDNIVWVLKLDKKKMYGRPAVYDEKDKISTPILKGLEIDLDQVFKE